MKKVMVLAVVGVFSLFSLTTLILWNNGKRADKDRDAVYRVLQQLQDCVTVKGNDDPECRRLAAQSAPIVRVESGGQTRIIYPPPPAPAPRSSPAPGATPRPSSRPPPGPKRTPRPSRRPSPRPTCNPVCLPSFPKVP